MQPVEQTVDLAPRVGMAEHRKAEGGLGDENVARYRHEPLASWIGTALVVPGYDDPLAFMLHHYLRAAEHVTGGDEAHVDLADADRLVIGDALPARLRAVTCLHDRQRF